MFFGRDLRQRNPVYANIEPGVNAYEDKSFLTICRRILNPYQYPQLQFLSKHLDTLRAVGPIVIDQTFQNSSLHWYHRFDGVFFGRNNTGKTVPLAILETKSGIIRQDDYIKKLRGLEALFIMLDARQHEEEFKLGKILNAALPPDWGLTDEIVIPDPSEITFIVAAPEPMKFVTHMPTIFRNVIQSPVSQNPIDRYLESAFS